ncbi:MAG: nucleotide-binding protein [Candidatus Thorarchaeota archaeon]|nr:nucleotide-binding protein [Candidatus Thorarchaeota archaeon]
MPLIVVLDANILTVPGQFGVDIFAESKRILEKRIEFVVLDSVVRELERKLEISGRIESRIFRIALDLIDSNDVTVVEGQSKEMPVDEQILQFAQTSQGVLATNDRGLREQALSQGIPILFLRGKKQLQLMGTIL